MHKRTNPEQETSCPGAGGGRHSSVPFDAAQLRGPECTRMTGMGVFMETEEAPAALGSA